MLVLAKVAESLSEARKRLQKVLESGAALECFRQNVEAQGGDSRVCDAPDRILPLVSESVKVESPRSGFATRINATEIGHAIAAIGGGRVRIEDIIDPTVGFITDVKIGDKVAAGATLGTVYCRDQQKAREAAHRIEAAYEIGDEPPAEIPQLIKEVINE
jgi:thymidine phosphorylase